MQFIFEMLNHINSQIDWEHENEYVSKGLLCSLDILRCLIDMEQEYNIEFDPSEIKVENFESAEKMWSLISKHINK